MLRKMIVVAAAAAIPLTLVTVVAGAGGGIAAAKGGPNGPVTCTIGATVNFAKPGISNNGSESTKTTSKTSTANEVLGGAWLYGNREEPQDHGRERGVHR